MNKLRRSHSGGALLIVAEAVTHLSRLSPLLHFRSNNFPFLFLEYRHLTNHLITLISPCLIVESIVYSAEEL